MALPDPWTVPVPHPPHVRLGALLSARLDRAGDAVTLVLTGEFDLAGVAPFTELVEGIEATGPNTLVLDVSGLDFLDSSGMRQVYDAHVRAEGRYAFGVVLGTGPAFRSLALAGLDQALTVVASAQEMSAA